MEDDSYFDGCHGGLFRRAAAVRPLQVDIAVVVGARAVNVLLDIAHPFLRAADLDVVELSDVDAALSGDRHWHAVAIVPMGGVGAIVAAAIGLLAEGADHTSTHAALATDTVVKRGRVGVTDEGERSRPVGVLVSASESVVALVAVADAMDPRLAGPP